MPSIGRPGEQLADPTRFFARNPPSFKAEGAVILHGELQDYAPYRQRFSNRIKKHFFVDIADPTSGTFAIVGGIDRAAQLFQNQMAKFEPVLFCESFRWGAMDAFGTHRTTPFTKSDSTDLSKPYGDWDRNTTYRMSVWLPERRAHYLQ